MALLKDRQTIRTKVWSPVFQFSVPSVLISLLSKWPEKRLKLVMSSLALHVHVHTLRSVWNKYGNTIYIYYNLMFIASCTISCQNEGFRMQAVDQSTCECQCPSGLKGATCEELDTDAGQWNNINQSTECTCWSS